MKTNRAKRRLVECTVFVIVLIAGLMVGRVSEPFAAGRTSQSGIGIRVAFPRGDASDLFNTGWGLTGSSLRKFSPRLGLLSELSWNSLPAKDGSITVDFGSGSEIIDVSDASSFAIVLGPLIDLGGLDIGAKGGYFFGDFGEWDLLPFAQIWISRLSLGAEYKALGDIKWLAGYASFWF